MLDKFIRKLLIITALGLSFQVLGQSSFTPSKEQLELFKQLPPEQQAALAKKYGLDLQNLGITDPNQEAEGQANKPYVLPRFGQGNVEAQAETPEQVKVTPEDEDELKPFGYDLFAGQPTTFAPMSRAPVPSNYVVGAGDQLLVNLYGKDNQQYELTINREGKLEVPGLAPISVAGMTFVEAKDFVKSKVEEQFIGVKAAVSFGELRSIQVFVLGESFTPGVYTVSSLSTITHALFASGGIKEVGSLRNIQLKRAGQVVATLDLYDLLLRGDTRNDMILQSGDAVFVPAAGKRVVVKGAVNRPAIYELGADETYADLMRTVGGVTSEAFVEKVSTFAFANGAKQIANIDLSKAANLNKPLNAVVEVNVPQIGERIDNAIHLLGEVTRPGFYQWYEGISVSAVISQETGLFTDHSDASYGLVLRYDQGQTSIFQFTPRGVRENGAEDVALLPHDKVYVFSTQQRIRQLLSFDEMLKEDATKDIIQEKARASIQEQFFWEMVGSIERQSAQFLNVEGNNLPSIYELEYLNFAELVNSYRIYRWPPHSRNYLLWSIYQFILEKNVIGQRLPLVEVTGNVRYPGTYPLPQKGTLSDILVAAGGLSDLSAEVIKVSRQSDNGVVQMDVAVAEASTFVMNGKDKVAVFVRPEASDFVNVQIRGEVEFPGTYSVRRGEKLSTLIEKAGGFTDYAHPSGSVFTRLSLQAQENANLKNLTNQLRKELASKRLTASSTDIGNASYAEIQRVIQDLSDSEALGRMVIDMPALMAGDSDADIELVRGDKLIIPPRNQTVSVVGEVFLPVSHRYSADLTIDAYIESSGGIKKLGDEDNVYVVKSNGAVVRPKSAFWFNAGEEAMLEPGDTIVVPINSSPIENLTLWSTITQIVYQTGIAIAAIGSL